MILNLTRKPLQNFSVMQRLAASGEQVVTPMKCETIDDFYAVLERYENVLTKIIISKDDTVFANDVCNAVSCPVVTLDIETLCDTGEINFLEYDAYEED